MLDTINFKLTADDLTRVDFLSEIPPYLDPDSIGFHDFNGQQVVTGRLDNLKVSINSYQVRVKDGSVCKWMLGDNYQAMGRRDIQHAVERLSDILHLPMARATITRLDVGLSIPVKHPIENYINHLGLLKYARRFQQGAETLYYYRHQQAERLCFYDKNREQRANGEEIPELYQRGQVLRYEQRYLKQLPRLFKVVEVTGATLYDEAFYIDLLNRWRDTYREIKKLNDVTINFQAMKSKKDLQKMGVLALVEQWGGEVEMIAHINEAQRRGDITSKQAFDLRQAIKEACQAREGLTMPTEEIAELNKKIASAIRAYR